MDNSITRDGEMMEVEELEFAPAPKRPLIPDGRYQARFVRAEAEAMQMYRGAARLFLHFEIIEPGDAYGTRIYGGWPLGAIVIEHGKKRCKAKKGDSDLKIMLKRLLGSAARPDRVSFASLKDKVILIQTRTVKTTGRQRKRGPADQYSVVDDMVEIVAGE
jgi:hypothetical protein